jgi:hypothetical protein
MPFFNRWMRGAWIGSTLVFIALFCQKATDGFTLLKISPSQLSNAYSPTQLTEQEEVELKEALSQPYTYFGCGGQAYAFFSTDGKYVVKFFKQRLFRPSWLLNHLPLPKLLHRFRNKRNWKRLDKYRRDYFSYDVSSKALRDQTGVLYSHLQPTDSLKQTLQIQDRLGITHNIDLDRFDFLVQKRAEMVHDRIARLMGEARIEEAKQSLQQVFSLISTRAQRGYRDRDPNIRTNCGFLGDKAIKIDVGRFVIDPAMQTKAGHNQELERITAPFRLWISENYPELLNSFDHSLQEALL